jgi:hypothetical protein
MSFQPVIDKKPLALRKFFKFSPVRFTYSKYILSAAAATVRKLQAWDMMPANAH